MLLSPVSAYGGPEKGPVSLALASYWAVPVTRTMKTIQACSSRLGSKDPLTPMLPEAKPVPVLVEKLPLALKLAPLGEVPLAVPDPHWTFSVSPGATRQAVPSRAISTATVTLAPSFKTSASGRAFGAASRSTLSTFVGSVRTVKVRE